MAALLPCGFDKLPGWDAAELAPALAAFRRSAPAILDGSVKTGAFGVEASAYAAAAREAVSVDASRARAFFEARFRPARIAPRPGERPGLLTGYYEPEVEACLFATARFAHPLYRRPPDLVKVDDVSRPPGLDPYFRFARRRPSGLLDEYPDRAAIGAGYLAGKNLELAWLEDPVDAFFIHVQGSARLVLADGRTLRVTYAGKSGHPFTAIGRVLVEARELTLEQADMAGIRGWLAANPHRVRGLLERNRSFIFFETVEALDPDLGPIGAAKVPLTPLASIAVDRELHTFGAPFFVDAPDLLIDGAPFRRLTIAQDTGSAIIGPARADLFVGSGQAAGEIAGRIRHPADFFLLRPAEFAGSAGR